MVSEFLCEEVGQLKLNDDQFKNHPNISEKAQVYLKPGKNQEGYWT